VKRSSFNPLLFTRTFLMTYSKRKLKSNVDKVSSSARPFLRRNNECLPNQTLIWGLLKHVSNNLISRGYQSQCGPGSPVGIATAYGLKGPGIESRCGRDFPHLSRADLSPTQTPVQWVPGLPPGVRWGRGVTLAPHPLLVVCFPGVTTHFGCIFTAR
jgi:hypothetical protein